MVTGFLSNVLLGPLNSLLASLSCASEKTLVALMGLDLLYPMCFSCVLGMHACFSVQRSG